MVMRALAVVSSAVLAITAGAAAGCGSAVGPSSPSPSSSAATSGPPTAAPSTTGPAAAAGCDATPWRAAPITVTHHVSAPPVPVITAVRVAQHPGCGYDRVVLDIAGPLPAYSVQYVDHVTADPSGRTLTMPGSRYLVITLRPAQAHTNAGTATVTAGVHQARYPSLASWAVAGDFEGVVRIAMGLSGPASIRTGELSGRIYIDIRE
jgi:hypothetical protein